MNINDEVYFIDKNDWICIVRPGVILGGTSYTEVQPVKSDEIDKMIIDAGLELEPLYYGSYTVLDDDHCLPRTEENRNKLLHFAAKLNVCVIKTIDSIIDTHAKDLGRMQLRKSAMEAFIRMSNNVNGLPL